MVSANNRRVIGLDILEMAVQEAKADASKCCTSAFVEFLNAGFFFTYNPPCKFDAVFDYTLARLCDASKFKAAVGGKKMAELLGSDWGEFLGIIGRDPSVCKSNRLHVDILRFCFIKLGYIL